MTTTTLKNSSEGPSIESEGAPKYTPLCRLLSLVAAVWAISGLALYGYKDRGTFGDMFGAVNALFSGLAFASLVYAIYLQRQELQLQRQELRDTRAELEGQKHQLVAQNRLLEAQQFDSAFFRVLELFANVVNAIDRNRQSRLVKGRDCFPLFVGDLQNQYVTTSPDLGEVERIQRAYREFFKANQNDVGHYFRTLYNLVKLVDRSGVTDKRFYMNLVRAQLSSHELLLLFYNCQSDLGRDKFKPLVERYALLKAFPRERLLQPTHVNLFDSSAYGEAQSG